MNKIGWIGTGKMGQRMSSRLIMEGNEVVVNDKLKANADIVVSAGAKFVQTPAKLADCADYIFTMIPNSKVLKEIDHRKRRIAGKPKTGNNCNRYEYT